MNDLTKLIVVSSLAASLALTMPGCGGSSSPSESSHSAGDGHGHSDDDGRGHSDDDGHGHGDDDGHGHNESGHEGHDHGPGEHDDHDHDDGGHGHGEERSLGSVAIGGTTLTVSMSGDLEPGAEIHVDLEHTGGPAPAAIRLWIGDEAGTGALKSKAHANDGNFEAHAEAPSDITGASLWIEVESASGERASGSLQLP